MSLCNSQASARGVTLIELAIAAAIASTVAIIIVPNYFSYRVRAERGNGESCLIDLVRKQDGYFVHNNHYTNDLTNLGYDAASSASCANTQKYRLTAAIVDADACPLSRCYRLSAIPQDIQISDGALHLIYDASQTDPNFRIKKERGPLGSGAPWDK